MVLAGPDITELENFYVGTFNLNPEPHRDYNLDLVSQAQGQPAGTTYPLGLLRLGERGNNIELDEYPAGTSARPSADGQLPPGVAMTTFSVEDLSAIDIDFIADPVIDNGGKRAATLIGPAGELTELIEDPRP